MTDYISRADAINAFWEDSDIRTAEVRATLKALPSADAVQGGDAKMDNCQAQAPQNYMQQSRHDDGRMTREEAIQVLKEYRTIVMYHLEAETPAFDMAIESLKDRPQGEWKHTITWQPYCSNCEYVFGEDEEYSPLWKFCPMCGAEMADNSLFNDITESSSDDIEPQNDVIEVVRCKDCRYWEYVQDDGDCIRHTDDTLGYAINTNADDFCSYGERREE